MSTNRRDQCWAPGCTSRSCYFRISTPILAAGPVFDEIACQRHVDDLCAHADETLSGALRNHLTSHRKLSRLGSQRSGGA